MASNSASLQGKIALVTGASRGIGRAIAVALAKSGARRGGELQGPCAPRRPRRSPAEIKDSGRPRLRHPGRRVDLR